MPTISDLSSTETFKDWHTTKCGHTQFHQGPSMWFAQPVHNPWVKYIRQTLGSDGYSFALDEGPFGGNSQCHTDRREGWTAPTGLRITACPDPEPPHPTPGRTTPAPTPAPSGTCKVGDHVFCPGASYKCTGAQCCQDGTTCPSAPKQFKGCPKGKTVDCTAGLKMEDGRVPGGPAASMDVIV